MMITDEQFEIQGMIFNALEDPKKISLGDAMKLAGAAITKAGEEHILAYYGYKLLGAVAGHSARLTKDARARAGFEDLAGRSYWNAAKLSQPDEREILLSFAREYIPTLPDLTAHRPDKNHESMS